MPLVSSDWAKALAGESIAWDHLELNQPPQDWSKLTCWAAKHCKYTRSLAIEDIEPGSEAALAELLCHPFFCALQSVKLTGSLLGQVSGKSTMLWEALLCRRLHSLNIQLESINNTELCSVSCATDLQYLSLDIKQRTRADHVELPGMLTNLLHLTRLSLRNVSVSQRTVCHEFSLLTSLEDLSLVRTDVSNFDFSFHHLSRLSSLLLSEDHRAGQALRLPGISHLPSLQQLSISSGLQQFPEDVLNLTSLTSLDLGWNRFRMLPPGPYLKNLQDLQFQERSSVLDVAVLEQASRLSLLSFDATDMAYKDITATVCSLIRRLPNLHRVVLLKASYNGAADREDQIAQSFLQLVNVLCQDMFCRRSIQIDLEHKWRPLLWSDVGR
jgi:hypothetical protein